MSTKHIIFDFDGVIVDSFAYHLNHYRTLFPDAGMTKEELYDVHLGNFLHGQDSEVWQKVDLTVYDKTLVEDLPKQKLVPTGFKEMLEGVDAKKYVVSSGPEISMNPTLQAANIREYFSEVYGKETHSSKVEKIDMVYEKYGCTNENSVFVTDTVGDIQEGQKVGIPVIAVTYGFHSREDLEKARPNYIVDSVQELDGLLKELC